MNAEEPRSGSFSIKETVFAIGSGITAIGFWGLAIDVALRSYIYQETVVLQTGAALWFFAGIFVIGLVAMGISSLKRVGTRG
jgi:hypothetical protein